jgi:hypothetical protein
LFSLAFNLPDGSEIYADKGYTDYLAEDLLSEADALALMALRKRGSTRADSPPLAYVKRTVRHYIETVFSCITSVFPKGIHAVTFKGFLLKVSCFIWSYSLERAFL